MRNDFSTLRHNNLRLQVIINFVQKEVKVNYHSRLHIRSHMPFLSFRDIGHDLVIMLMIGAKLVII